MIRLRGVWSVGLAAGLAGCAGGQQSLVSQSSAGSARGVSRPLAWQGGSAPAAALAPAPAEPAATGATVAAQPDGPGPGSPTVVTPEPAKVTVEPASRAGVNQTGNQVSRYFPLFNGRGGSEAGKADLIRPAGRDLWADAARAGAESRLAAWREKNGSTQTVLPVAMQVSPAGTAVLPKPTTPAATTTPEALPTMAATTTPEALPDAVDAAEEVAVEGEPKPPSHVQQTSAQSASLPGPSLTAPPLPDSPPSPDAVAVLPDEPAKTPEPAPAPVPKLADEPAQTADPAPAPAPAANEPAKTPEPAPAPVPEVVEPEAKPPVGPAPAPEAAMNTGTAGGIVPAVTPEAQGRPTAQASPQEHAPVAVAATTRKPSWLRRHLAALGRHRPAQVEPSPQTSGLEALAKADAKAKIPPNQPRFISPVEVTAATNQLFPATYYRNPGADAIRPVVRDVTAVAFDNPKPLPTRPTLIARLAARFRGSEEVESHPTGCTCGKHPLTVAARPPSAGSVGAKPDNVSERRDVVERVSADRLDEPAQR